MKANQPLAIQLAKRQLPELVCDAVNLEGIHYTLPEIVTILDGVTVGGHKLSDQNVALNQADTWRFLFDAVEKGRFSLTQSFVCESHAIAAKDEALKWGSFRDGQVTISGTDYLPPPADQLDSCFSKMIVDSLGYADVYDRAIFVFLTMARTQFFYDVNKRMGRFMMNAILLEAGFPVINVPAKRQLEFNTLMLSFYTSNEQEPMNQFMRSCLDPRVVEFFS